MQIFKLIRGEFDHGISPISREFFSVELNQDVTRSETQGRDVFVEVSGKISNRPDILNNILKRWRAYYEANRNRYGFIEHVLYGKDVQLAEYLGPHDDKRYGKPEDVEQLLAKSDEYKRYKNVADEPENPLDSVLNEYEKAALLKRNFDDQGGCTS